MTQAQPNTPAWGAALRPLWGIEEGLRFLNHGSYGATPLSVLAEQAEWRAGMERNTARFFARTLPGALREAAAAAAAFVRTEPDRLGFVVNATAAVNAVARSLDFAPGDEILLTDHVYNAVRHTWRHIADLTGAVLTEAMIGMPVTGADQIIDAIAAAITPRTRLVVIDHVASASAVTFPAAAIAALCRARGIAVLVDGAHAPGLVELDVDAIDADWYVGNFHKWVCAPKGSAFIAVSKRPTAPIHPLAISHAYGQGFQAEFDMTGTHDPTPALCVPAAIAFHEQLGGPALRDRNRTLARDMASRIAAELGTEPGASLALFQAMSTIRLPLAAPDHADAIRRIHDHLYDSHRIESAITTLAGNLYLRLSVQAYTDPAEFDGLADAATQAIAALHA